jgi:hypothetical protein
LRHHFKVVYFHVGKGFYSVKPHSYQKAAERGGYGDERYEKLEFQKKVAEHYKVLHDASWKVMNCFSGLFILN